MKSGKHGDRAEYQTTESLHYAWGCEVTAFSSSPSKEAEARKLGADRFVNSRDREALTAAANSLNFILSTATADLDWNAYIATLRRKGKLRFVGV